VYPRGLPARRWLDHYATLFDTVEVNTTFYRLPSTTAVGGWAEQTPDGFLFAVKASRYLTHIKRLADMAQGVRRFHERIEPLVEAGKLGSRVAATASPACVGAAAWSRRRRRSGRGRCRMAVSMAGAPR